MDDLDLGLLPAVTYAPGSGSGEMDLASFFAAICNLDLDRTPVNCHRKSRARPRSV